MVVPAAIRGCIGLVGILREKGIDLGGLAKPLSENIVDSAIGVEVEAKWSSLR